MHCLSLATGVKCLPCNKVVKAKGLALHDSHAEILAIRGFNRFAPSLHELIPIFLLDEVIKLQDDDTYDSTWVTRITDGTGPQFKFSASSIYLFISGPPCGDASLDLLAEDPDNAIPWTTPTSSEENCLHGHEYIWERGKVRFKPGNSSYE
jgi:tRNA-specific adenosine deaminase 1